jgi:hypothetical protein
METVRPLQSILRGHAGKALRGLEHNQAIDWRAVTAGPGQAD